jgi:hypothetical protein
MEIAYIGLYVKLETIKCLFRFLIRNFMDFKQRKLSINGLSVWELSCRFFFHIHQKIRL